MSKGLELSIQYPYKVYLTLVANGTRSSDFGIYELDVQFKKYDPDAEEENSSTGQIVVSNVNKTKTVIVGKFNVSLIALIQKNLCGNQTT